MNILIVALHYHDYTQRIIDEITALGHTVSVHDIMPRSLRMKAARVLQPALWQRWLDAHHEAILAAERGRVYDMVLFIQVHQLSQPNLAAFRETFADARFVLYNWDSIANHDYLGHVRAFDDVFTFDPDDARQHGFRYLPLFCTRDFQRPDRAVQQSRRVYFVGNIVNPRRYAALAAFRAYTARHGIVLDDYAACTPPAFINLLRAGLRPQRIKFESIAPAALARMVGTASATFDYANHHQSGYTMRVIENLCAGKKIITNNARVQNEWFYSPDRFFIFDRLEFDGVDAFLDVPLSDPNADFPEFHVQTFVGNLLDGRGHAFPPLPEQTA